MVTRTPITMFTSAMATRWVVRIVPTGARYDMVSKTNEGPPLVEFYDADEANDSGRTMSGALGQFVTRLTAAKLVTGWEAGRYRPGWCLSAEKPVKWTIGWSTVALIVDWVQQEVAKLENEG